MRNAGRSLFLLIFKKGEKHGSSRTGHNFSTHASRRISISRGGTCNFVVGMKEALGEEGQMNADAQKAGGWDKSDRRAWCNDTLKNSIPITLQPIFKEMNVVASDGETNGAAVTSVDTWALVSATEGVGDRASIPAEAGLFQFEYYKTIENTRSTWTRSGHYDSMRNGYGFSLLSTLGGLTSDRADREHPLIMFGCI